MGLQPKQPRGQAGPGQWEAAFSCQGGALLRLSPSLRGPTTVGASMPARLEVEQPEATQVTAGDRDASPAAAVSLLGSP